MNALQPIAAALHADLSEECLLCEELLALIALEKQQVERGEQDALAGGLAAKHLLLDSLQTVTTRRMTLLEHHGRATGEDLPMQWTAALGGFPTLASLHARLQRLVTGLREENRTFGMLVSRKAHFVAGLLDHMHASTLATGTYEPNGSKQREAGSRRLTAV